MESPLRQTTRETQETPEPPATLCVQRWGFSLHAGLFAGARDRKKLERLLKYGMRPPFSQKRLSLTPQGKVRLKLRKPYYTGATEVLFQPLDFLKRLAALIPPPRQNQVRFYGVFAPHAKHKAALLSLLPQPPQDQSAMQKICVHLGLPQEILPVAPARSPPQGVLADWA